MDLGLHDHIILVTGGAKGIGAQVAPKASAISRSVQPCWNKYHARRRRHSRQSWGCLMPPIVRNSGEFSFVPEP
jgi:hypothetical protein